MWPALASSMSNMSLGMKHADYKVNQWATNEQNWENRKNAEQQMLFQYNMSGTAHQREVEDLKAAGLNPKLSAGGAGASSPSGAMAHTERVNPPEIMMPNFLEALSAQRDQDRLDNETANTIANIEKTRTETKDKESDIGLKTIKKKLMNKGMIRADVEGEAASLLGDTIQWLKKNKARTQVPKLSNGNNMPWIP